MAVVRTEDAFERVELRARDVRQARRVGHVERLQVHKVVQHVRDVEDLDLAVAGKLARTVLGTGSRADGRALGLGQDGRWVKSRRAAEMKAISSRH